MDPQALQELGVFAREQIAIADEYAILREKAGKLECSLELMVSERLEWYRAEKSNLGYSMAVLMLIAENQEAAGIFKVWKETEAQYKGLEKKIEARQSLISYQQSVMKYVLAGEKYA